MFTLNVVRQIEAAHANGPPMSKCHTMHGHSWMIEVELSGGDTDLNEWGWLVDFSDIKTIIDLFDHKTLNDLPALEGAPPSAECLAMAIFKIIVDQTKRTPKFVRVQEGKGNTVTYSRHA